MQTMTCRQLGGACDLEFHAETFEKIAESSKNHGMKMLKKGDKSHVEAMEKMKKLIKSPEGMKEWYDSKKKEFESLPEDKK